LQKANKEASDAAILEEPKKPELKRKNTKNSLSMARSQTTFMRQASKTSKSPMQKSLKQALVSKVKKQAT